MRDFVVGVPVGLNLIRPLKRPDSSSSVHGSFRIESWGVAASSSALCGDTGELAAAGVGDLGCEVGVGDAAWETRCFLRGGIVGYAIVMQLCLMHNAVICSLLV